MTPSWELEPRCCCSISAITAARCRRWGECGHVDPGSRRVLLVLRLFLCIPRRLSTSTLSKDALQELAALRALKPSLKITDLLENEAPETGAMARLTFQRSVWAGRGAAVRGRKGLPSSRAAPPHSRSLC